MRILIVHNSYRQKGGEDTVVENEVILLEKVGHEVMQFTVNNDGINGVMNKINAFISAIYSFSSKNRLENLIKDFEPDIVHVHNFFPLISPSVYYACKQMKVPVVQTIHNHRIYCPSGLRLLNNQVCKRCHKGNFLHAVKYKCYKGSRIGSMSVALMDFIHYSISTWNNKISKILAISPFMKEQLEEFGISSKNIVVKPNFVNASNNQVKNKRRIGGLFVGRLSEEKGIKPLSDALQQFEGDFSIIGDGPLKEFVERGNSRVLKGWLPNNEVKIKMQEALYLVIPSIWEEPFGMTIIEAYANGLPVIGSRIGAIKDLIIEGETGLLFTPGNSDELREKINWAESHPEEMNRMGKRAYAEYLEHYSSEKNLEQLVNIYQNTIDEYSE